MSIKGFRVGNDTEKYDYPSLDNIPEGLVQDPLYQHIDVDAELDEESENPVQNKVVAKALSGDSDSRLLEIALGAYPSDTASGAVATFPDGADGLPVKSLVAQISPVQDLHGFDHPWPAGGGANKLPMDNFENGIISTGVILTSANCLADSTFYWFDPGTYTFSAAFDVGTSVQGGIARYSAESEDAFLDYITPFTALPVTITLAERSCVRFTARPHPTTNITPSNLTFVGFCAGTEPTTEPYENLCPISGWTGLRGCRTGENLFVPQWDAQRTVSGVTFKANADGTVTIKGTSTSASLYTPSTGGSAMFGVAQPLKAGNYRVQHFADNYQSGVYVWVRRYDRQGNIIAPVASTNNANHYASFVMPEDGYVFVRLYADASGTEFDCTVGVAISPAASPLTEYAPTDGTQIAASWETEAGTVYGGEVDLVSGGLADRTLSITFDGTEDGWSYSTASARFYLEALPNAIAKSTNGVNSIGLCTHYAVITNISGSQFYNVDMALAYSNSSIASNKALAIRDSRFTDINSFKAMLAEQYAAGKPVKLVYLRDPYAIYQLPGTPIPTHKGVNNVWATTGDVAVNYRADTALYIEKKLGEQL